MLPGICPDNGCTETQSCSKESLRVWAQGVCKVNCRKVGLSLYPDLTRTEPYNTGNIACPNPFFDAPTLAEPPACEAMGSLPQRIKLTNPLEETDPAYEYQDNSGAGLIWNSSVVILLLFCEFLLH